MMKFKRIMAIGLTLALIFSSMANVFAYPLEGINYDGIQVNDTFYSLGYITGNESAFGDTFGPANSNNVILDFNQKAAKFSNYLSANPADFDEWASNSANQTAPNPTKFVKGDGTVVNVEPGEEELTVVDVDVLNRTTIRIEFSDGAIENFTVSALSVGHNTRTVNYEGESFTVQVSYYPSQVSVENVEFVNYRNFRVYFDGLVDEASATDATNYYMEIVDGDAAYGHGPQFPTLQDSNQLSKIETNYPGNAAGWWKDHIVAFEENGRTVVDIFLPEDARFTNVVDEYSGGYPHHSWSEDAERTLGIEMRDSKTDGYILKLLTKDTVVNVAVRNIKDLDENFTVDTAVMPIRILDTVKPELLDVEIVEKDFEGCIRPRSYQGLPRDIGSFELLRTKPSVDQVGEELQFVYSEPVFDAHRKLDMSDLDYYRDITLYVNGKKVASLSDKNLKEFMDFEMSENGTYEEATIVTLDAEKAVKAAYDENFATEKFYTIRFVGVSDLAGNIEVSSDHSFKVKFYDDPVVNPNPVTPVVLGVVQIADNIFRIEFNRVDVKGEFVIEVPDGEGYGEYIEVEVPRSAKSENGKFYSYVAVPAMDHEPNDAIPTGVNQNEILAYDGNDEIYRYIRVQDVYVCDRDDDIADYTLRGNDYIPANQMTIINDILAPVALDAEDMAYGSSTLCIPVEDVTPWEDDENADYWVSPIAYKYFDEKFGNEIEEDQEDADTYLPILVSYEDSRGAIHEALVTNHPTKPENGSVHPGYLGSISFDTTKYELVLDLSNYPELLDGVGGNLVEGATYKVDIPKGYFTDSPKDIDFWNGDEEFEFSNYDLDMLYVDDGRDDDDYDWVRIMRRHQKVIVDSGLGYTSDAMTVYAYVEEEPEDEPDPEAVPQTSKQLIFYDEATNSMRIEFTGTIDVATLKDKNNYSFDGKTLAEWDDELDTDTEIKYVVNGNQQFAVFVIPQDSIQEEGDYAFTVSGVAHPDGAVMTPVETVVRLVDNFRPVVEEARVMASGQIMLTFNEPIRYFVDPESLADPHALANNFLVMIDGYIEWDLDTAVLPSGEDNDREIVLNGTDLPAGDITVEIVKDQNNNILVIDKSPLKNPLKEDIYDVERP